MNTLVIKPTIKNDYLEVHFNLWNSDANNLHFLDIGIMCDNKTQEINIEIPCSENINIKDLSNELKEDIRNSIFNCNVDKETKGAFEILKKSETHDDKFLLSPIKEQTVSSNDNGIASFSIKVNEIPKNEINNIEIKKKYLRLRIENIDLSKFIINQDSDSRIFESSYMTYTIIDFRFNDYKLLPSNKLQELKLEDVTYEKIHFFYMTDILENINVCSSEYDVRFLERNIWNRYLGLTERKKDMIAYHLKSKDCSNASFLIKSQQQKTSEKHLLFYACIVIYLAIIANFIFSFIPIKNGSNQFNLKICILAGGITFIIPVILYFFAKITKKFKNLINKKRIKNS